MPETKTPEEIAAAEKQKVKDALRSEMREIKKEDGAGEKDLQKPTTPPDSSKEAGELEVDNKLEQSRNNLITSVQNFRSEFAELLEDDSYNYKAQIDDLQNELETAVKIEKLEELMPKVENLKQELHTAQELQQAKNNIIIEVHELKSKVDELTDSSYSLRLNTLGDDIQNAENIEALGKSTEELADFKSELEQKKTRMQTQEAERAKLKEDREVLTSPLEQYFYELDKLDEEHETKKEIRALIDKINNMSKSDLDSQSADIIDQIDVYKKLVEQAEKKQKPEPHYLLDKPINIIINGNIHEGAVTGVASLRIGRTFSYDVKFVDGHSHPYSEKDLKQGEHEYQTALEQEKERLEQKLISVVAKGLINLKQVGESLSSEQKQDIELEKSYKDFASRIDELPNADTVKNEKSLNQLKKWKEQMERLQKDIDDKFEQCQEFAEENAKRAAEEPAEPDLPTLKQQAEQAYKDEDYARIIELQKRILKKELEKEPESLLPNLYDLGVAYFNNEDYQGVIDTFEKYFRTDVKEEDMNRDFAFFPLGQAYLFTGQYEKAIKNLKQSIDIFNQKIEKYKKDDDKDALELVQNLTRRRQESEFFLSQAEIRQSPEKVKFVIGRAYLDKEDFRQNFKQGEIIELEQKEDAPVSLEIENKRVAHGELVTANDDKVKIQMAGYDQEEIKQQEDKIELQVRAGQAKEIKQILEQEVRIGDAFPIQYDQREAVTIFDLFINDQQVGTGRWGVVGENQAIKVVSVDDERLKEVLGEQEETKGVLNLEDAEIFENYKTARDATIREIVDSEIFNIDDFEEEEDKEAIKGVIREVLQERYTDTKAVELELVVDATMLKLENQLLRKK